ncbi:T9SS type A sorting domain-containing protein, partial [candidate division KSB1 bacterium]|nr:T9SS type A sorting domain-containing protein [candidate division KSB1 bacterium]
SVERVVKLLKQGHNDNDLDADISAAIQVGNEIRQSIDQSEHQQTTTISGLESTGVQSYPNPFNASTAILYNLKSASYVTIKIYDILGRLVKVLADSWQKPGQHGLVWNGRNDNENFVASGVYLVTIKTDQITKTLKVAYVK